jgi:hypothetical protein
MHMEQSFVDNLDAYVWIYDPIPFYYLVIGTFIVFGGIGICLFPLWPPQVRYVYCNLFYFKLPISFQLPNCLSKY